MKLVKLPLYIYAHIDKMNNRVKLHMLNFGDYKYLEHPCESSTTILEVMKGLQKIVKLIDRPARCIIIQPYAEIIEIFKPYSGKKNISSFSTPYGSETTKVCKEFISYMRSHHLRFKFYYN